MTATISHTNPPADALEHLLDVTLKLAGPFELMAMLEEVIEAGKTALNVEKIHLWMHDPDTLELVLRMPAGAERVRLPVDRGLIGECARTREIINVPDCYADSRFSPELDERTGYRSNNMLVLPLVGHAETLVGVLQLLNDRDGVFDDNDQRIAAYMAAQCATALQRAQMSDAMVTSARLKEDVSVAREVQMSTVPQKMPTVKGYDLFGTFLPADETGGDTFDIVTLDDGRLFVCMGDATGHGIGPALPATQMQAMFRLALRLGTDLDSAFMHVNNQLTEDLSDDRFVTAFVGLLDPNDHNMYFHSGGQGPILHFRGASRSWD
ncbi:MAG: GAF domain-containing protein [Gemmatimonadales bacterium]|nr:MAG: GAF domain-containing protein [Gemmatimonadales bacterium]